MISNPTVHKKAREVNNTVRTLGGLLLCFLPMLISSSTPPTLLEAVQKQGFLKMLSLNGPSTFYEGPFGHAGFEYELAQAFADELGVELTILDKGSLSNILNAMGTTDSHFAATGLSIIDTRQDTIHFTIPYSNVTQQVIYQRDSTKPKSIEDILDKDIVVIKNSSHAATLRQLQLQYPNLKWREKQDIGMSGLLEMVHSGEAQITIVDSSAFISNSVIYPRARKAFDISEPEDIAWAFPRRNDKTLLQAANAFLSDYITQGKILELEKKYFSQPTVNEGSALEFVKRIEERLPLWVTFFKTSAKEHDLDWLFLAAISYQESLWNEKAKSYTGVRGLMMLTRKTAKELNITDRTDPEQSITGGARYFAQMHRRIPKGVIEPDRTWMALAAYNIGLGHLEDARVITQRQDGNPNRWKDVKERLPLLARAKYYRKTKHGYARGWEPVTYVERIRNYHTILVWHYENKKRQIAAKEAKKQLDIPLNTSPVAVPQL